MSDMLTAKEMQALLHVDRSTIYRMAEAGRLPAMKVGKQWRFPAEQVEIWVERNVTAPEPSVGRLSVGPAAEEEGPSELAMLLPLDCVQLIQDTFAELLGVMLVVTDLTGNPITEPSNACGLFQAATESPDALQRCIRSWHDLGTALDLEPRFMRSHLGLLCARGMIRVGAELKGMVVAGCVAPDRWPPSAAEMESMAEGFEVSPDRLSQHVNDVHYLDSAGRAAVLAYVQRVANIIAHIVDERHRLMGKLEAISRLAKL